MRLFGVGEVCEGFANREEVFAVFGGLQVGVEAGRWRWVVDFAAAGWLLVWRVVGRWQMEAYELIFSSRLVSGLESSGVVVGRTEADIVVYGACG